MLTKLRNIRKMRGHSIKKLSAMTGIHRDRISLIERDKVNPSWATVVKLAEALDAEIIIAI